MGRTDASNDVMIADYDSGEPTADPDWINGDIVGLRAVHGKHRVKARIKYQELKRANTSFLHILRIPEPLWLKLSRVKGITRARSQ